MPCHKRCCCVDMTLDDDDIHQTQSRNIVLLSLVSQSLNNILKCWSCYLYQITPRALPTRFMRRNHQRYNSVSFPEQNSNLTFGRVVLIKSEGFTNIIQSSIALIRRSKPTGVSSKPFVKEKEALHSFLNGIGGQKKAQYTNFLSKLVRRRPCLWD